VSAQEIDQYLDALEEPKRTTLARLRQTILDILPEAEQGISYGLPAFKVRGKTIAGFAAFKNHLSYLPHSGSVFPQLKDELKDYSTSSGALRFSIDQPGGRRSGGQISAVEDPVGVAGSEQVEVAIPENYPGFERWPATERLPSRPAQRCPRKAQHERWLQIARAGQ
jgi:uncharacterized protein YdhG (YjbR/CyaY superfamily)